MKIAIDCKSPLLQKSLELFLSNYLSSSKSCDIFIKDKKCVKDKRTFYISSESDADLVKPFSKQELIFALEKRYFSLDTKKQNNFIIEKEEVIEKVEPPIPPQEKKIEQENNNFSLLEKRIQLLTQEYQKNIINTIKAFYEK